MSLTQPRFVNCWLGGELRLGANGPTTGGQPLGETLGEESGLLLGGSQHQDVIKVNCHLEFGNLMSDEVRDNVVLPMRHTLIDEPSEGVRAPAETKGQ